MRLLSPFMKIENLKNEIRANTYLLEAISCSILIAPETHWSSWSYVYNVIFGIERTRVREILRFGTFQFLSIWTRVRT